ncbi:NYN domain-containing protein [Acetobacteraceae bacterium]|nr:NYN domain-containing protein [Acetobacteraceae bacterium]
MFKQTAFFVDAGYFLESSGHLLYGSGRGSLFLNTNAIANELSAAVEPITEGNRIKTEERGRLLRIYWYDAGDARHGLFSSLAQCPSIKLRLGRLNQNGVQKGVDALLALDLVTLASERAISDAIILSGDEDLVPAVEMIQRKGVRVHLLGIQPAMEGARNVSQKLRHEADSFTEWGRDKLDPLFFRKTPNEYGDTDPAFLNSVDTYIPNAAGGRPAASAFSNKMDSDFLMDDPETFESDLRERIAHFVDSLDEETKIYYENGVADAAQIGQPFPIRPEHDAPLLKIGCQVLGVPRIDPDWRRFVRAAFLENFRLTDEEDDLG